MMDAAHKPRLDHGGRIGDRQAAAVPHLDDLANIFRLRPSEPPYGAAPRERRPALTSNDIAAAMELVRDAAAVIREADERVRDGEARLHTLLERAAEQVKAADARAEAAEARAIEASARAEEAENWLRQIFATISHELPNRH